MKKNKRPVIGGENAADNSFIPGTVASVNEFTGIVPVISDSDLETYEEVYAELYGLTIPKATPEKFPRD
ncbi:MAG: hypothetical protein RSD32_09485 [Oscillospiraceae bacterium]